MQEPLTTMDKKGQTKKNLTPLKTVLVVAGSDPTAGAGLQADLKTVTALGGYAMTAVTAITVQDTGKVTQVHPLAPELVADQMTAVLADMRVDAIKLGMLATAEIVWTVAQIVARYPLIPVIADPVLAGTGGGQLLDGPGRRCFMEDLLPRLHLITPNAPEAARLTGLPVNDRKSQAAAAKVLAASGCSVLLTGGHLPGDPVVDLLVEATTDTCQVFRTPRRPGPGFHGTGCTLTAAAALGLAQGLTLVQSIAQALDHLQKSMDGHLVLGKGQRLLHCPRSS